MGSVVCGCDQCLWHCWISSLHAQSLFNAKPVWLVSDGCGTGIMVYIIQGETWDRGVMCVFYSMKLNPAQQNYPVHEIEMLAGIECMLWHRDVLQGLHFTWVTDHKGLIHLSNQKALSGRQAWCWRNSESSTSTWNMFLGCRIYWQMHCLAYGRMSLRELCMVEVCIPTTMWSTMTR